MMHRKIVIPTSDIFCYFNNIYQTWMIRNGCKIMPDGVISCPNGMSYQTDIKYMFNVIVDGVIHADNPIYAETAGVEVVSDAMFGFLKQRRRTTEEVELTYITRCKMLINSDVGLKNKITAENVDNDALNFFGVPTHKTRTYMAESDMFDDFYCNVIDSVYSRLVELVGSVMGEIRPYSQFDYVIEDCYTVLDYLGDSRVREWNEQHNLPKWNNS